MNTMFHDKDSHKYMWSAPGQGSIIDYIIHNGKLFTMVLDVKRFSRPRNWIQPLFSWKQNKTLA
jgi:hypothetical protein